MALVEGFPFPFNNNSTWFFRHCFTKIFKTICEVPNSNFNLLYFLDYV